MLELYRTDSENSGFQLLYPLLDEELAIRDGDDHAFYAQFNKVDKIQYVIIALKDGVPAGCGALKKYAENVVEVKRMFVLEKFRGQGIAMQILKALEIWAAEMDFPELVLETGKAQPEAIALYRKANYTIIPNYGQYAGIENSICMRKMITST